MGRGKVTMKLIEDPKKRNMTFKNRKEGLKKKAYELSTLCGVDICFICFKQDTNQLFSWPEDRSEVEHIINRYQRLNEKERVKRQIGCCSFAEEEKKKKMEENLSRTHQENTNMPIFPNTLEESIFSLHTLMSSLDEKLEMVKMRMKLPRSPQLQPFPLSWMKPQQQHIYSSHCFLPTPTTDLVTTNFMLTPSPHFKKSSNNNCSSGSSSSSSSSNQSTLPSLSEEGRLMAMANSLMLQAQLWLEGDQRFLGQFCSLPVPKPQWRGN